MIPLTQPADSGLCEPDEKYGLYSVDRQCAFSSEEGTCLHEYATYSGETVDEWQNDPAAVMSSALMVNVTKPRQGSSNDFGQAVSELARHWLPRGRTSCGTERVDVRAFTGKAKF